MRPWLGAILGRICGCQDRMMVAEEGWTIAGPRGGRGAVADCGTYFVHALVAAAPSEGALAEAFDRGGDLDRDQLGAVVKGARGDAGDRAGADGDRFQGGAPVEGLVVDGEDRGGDRDLDQAAATLECGIADAAHRLGDQAGAPDEG